MTTLHQAARTGNLDKIRDLLAAGSPVDLPEEGSGYTPLMIACMSVAAGPDSVETLIEAGADLNACVRLESKKPTDYGPLLDDEELDPEFREMIEKSRMMLGNFTPDVPPLIVAVIKEISLEKLSLLVKRGVDLQARSSCGYTAVFHAANSSRFDVLDFLIRAGAPLDGVSSYGESALSVLSHRGRFDQVAKLLSHGADPAPLGWDALMHAVALGSLDEVAVRVEAGADLEATDRWGRTPFLLGVHAGDCEKARLLLAKGAKRDAKGRCGHPALSYAVSRDDAGMAQWLLDRAFDPDEPDQFGHPPLKKAVEAGAIDCVRLLLDAGADWQGAAFPEGPLINSASEPEIIRILVERGEELADLEGDALRSFIGLGKTADLPVGREEYLAGRFRRFGAANPERMDIPFWKAMVRCGWSGYQAGRQFGDNSYECGQPAWSHDRFGMSLTALPDGRFVQIAGEHEDHYDPDFCIYNDVIIHDGKGGFEILGYPKEVFPPTDFHSATLVGNWIYIIGNLGYSESRKIGRTPVYRLDTVTFRIEGVATSGEEPGWIHSHRAVFEDGKIRISGGKIQLEAEDGSQSIEDHHSGYWFDPASGWWERADATGGTPVLLEGAVGDRARCYRRDVGAP